MRVWWRKAGRCLHSPAQYLLICSWKDTDSPAPSRSSTLTNILIPIWKRENPKSPPKCPLWAESSCSKATRIILHLHTPRGFSTRGCSWSPITEPLPGCPFSWGYPAHRVPPWTHSPSSEHRPVSQSPGGAQTGGTEQCGCGCPICLQKTCRTVVGEGISRDCHLLSLYCFYCCIIFAIFKGFFILEIEKYYPE